MYIYTYNIHCFILPLIRIQECVVNLSDLTQGPVTRFCDQVDEPSSYTESSEFIDQLGDYQLFNELCPVGLIIPLPLNF
jgi:hypothetical protein